MKRNSSQKFRWVLSALAAAFFLPLAIAVGWWPLWVIGKDAYDTRDWVQAPAQVRAATLAFPQNAKTSTGHANSSIEAQAIYEYEWKQKRYTGQRIGIGFSSSDSFGTWQRDTYDRLKNAEISGQPIRIWVNPMDPNQSVIDRHPRSEMLMFHGLCALLLTLLFALCIWLYLRLAEHKKRTKKPQPSVSHQQ
jgi:hypothetical protein